LSYGAAMMMVVVVVAVVVVMYCVSGGEAFESKIVNNVAYVCI
jgi:hypothetical protein